VDIKVLCGAPLEMLLISAAILESQVPTYLSIHLIPCPLILKVSYLQSNVTLQQAKASYE